MSNRSCRKTVKAVFALRSIFLPALVILAVLLLLFSPFKAQSAEYLTISGCSVSNLGYLSELAREYERRTGTKVFIRGGGSVVGLEDLRSGNVDLAAACRAREAGDPGGIAFIQVAWDALAFIVHRSNPVENVSLRDVRSIYAGRITNWKQLNGPDEQISVFISRTKRGLSGVEASTKKMVLDGKDPVESPNVHFVASSGIVEQMVEETPEGFAATGIISARKRNVKMLKVDGVAPTVNNIIQRRYPLKRPLFLLLPKNAKPEVKRFVDFALSRAGQQFIRSLNAIALVDMQ